MLLDPDVASLGAPQEVHREILRQPLGTDPNEGQLIPIRRKRERTAIVTAKPLDFEKVIDRERALMWVDGLGRRGTREENTH